MENKTMDFGKKYRVGNFAIVKYNKTLTKRELHELRQNIPADWKKYLQRGGLPYIKVSAISGVWAVEFSIGTSVFRMLDEAVADVEANKETLTHVITMWFTDTAVPGDKDYVQAKAKALQAFMERQKAQAVSDEENAKELEDLQKETEAKASIIDMSGAVKEGGEDGKV